MEAVIGSIIEVGKQIFTSQTADSASGGFSRHIVLMLLQEACTELQVEPVETLSKCPALAGTPRKAHGASRLPLGVCLVIKLG
jgi:hypothetical protein